MFFVFTHKSLTCMILFPSNKNTNAYYSLHTLKATAKATLFKVLFCRNSIRYLFENLDFEVCYFEHSEMVKTFIRDDRLPMLVSHLQLYDFACGNTRN